MGKVKQLTAVSILLLLSASFLIFVNPLVSCANPSPDDWLLFRHDASHTGFSTSSLSTSSIEQLWNYTLETEPLAAPSIPVAYNGFVYVTSLGQGLCCFEATTGEKIWEFTTESENTFSPAVIDDYVYFASDDEYVYCLDCKDGAEVWRYFAGFPINAPVNFAGDRLYVEASNGEVLCLDASNGDKVWSFPTDGRAFGFCPAVSEEYVFATNSKSDLFCLDAVLGSLIWNIEVGARVGSPTVVDGFVYLGSNDGNLYCFDASNGKKAWNYTTWFNAAGPAHGYHWGNTVSDPATAYGCVYVGSSDFDVFCIDEKTGTKNWNFSTNAGVFAAPSVVDGCVLAGSYDGNLYCLNASSGSELWQIPVGVYSPVNAAGSAGSPIVSDGIVFVVGNGILSAWGSPDESFVFPFLELAAVMIVVVIVVAVLGVIFYVKRRR